MCWMRGIYAFMRIFYKMLKHQPITVIMKPAQCLFILEVTGLLHKALFKSHFSQTNLFCCYETLKHSVSLPVVVSIIISTKLSPRFMCCLSGVLIFCLRLKVKEENLFALEIMILYLPVLIWTVWSVVFVQVKEKRSAFLEKRGKKCVN